MGRLKDSLLEPGGWDATPGRFVSPECFDDRALQDVINDNLVSRTCSYTGRTRKKKLIAATLDVVVERILEGLEAHYEDAANGVGWDEGEYVGATTWDTWDLIQDTVAFGDDADASLLEDITNALPARIWSHIDPYGPRQRDIMRWSWDDFTKTVKHERRYFFQQHLEPAEWHEEKVSPAELLENVLTNCRSFGLVRELPAGQRFFRCRPRDSAKRYTLPRELGPPPAAKASQSRMSPAGIPMFYGAREKGTAKAETLKEGHRYAIAEFRTTRAIQVLDLSRPPFVSIFDFDRGHLNDWCQFMHRFIRDFQRPVADDGEQHIEYVPTQIVTEYIRSAGRKGDRLDGILYESVKRAEGLCVVLFADESDVDPLPDTSKYPAGTHLLKMRQVWNKRRYCPRGDVD